MNICLLTSTYLPLIGGREMVVHNLATALTSMGHNVYVVTPYRRYHNIDNHCNYRIIRFGFRGYGRLKLTLPLAIFTLAQVARRFNIDIINVHNVYTPASWAYYFSQIFKKIPIIGTPHGDDIQRIPQIQWGVRLNPKLDKIVRRNITSFTRVTAISQSIRAELTQILPNGRCIRDVPNGVWTTDFQREINKVHVRKTYGIPLDSVALISVGRNAPIKGFEFGLDAVAKLLKAGFKISYILVGRNMSSITKGILNLGIEDYIIAPGQLNNDEVAKLYQASDIYISTSFIESFGVTTLEAMSSGLPCVVTNVAGSRELISPEYGLIVEPGNAKKLAEAITCLIQDPGGRKRMGAKARIEARKYDWPNIARMYVEVYKEATNEQSEHVLRRRNP